RGFYAGVVGYHIPGGTFDTCIALRTLLLHDGVAHLQAGGGLVADSDPAAEHEECLHKLAAVEHAIQLAEDERCFSWSTTTTRSRTTLPTWSASSGRRWWCSATTRSRSTRRSGWRRRTSSSRPGRADPRRPGSLRQSCAPSPAGFQCSASASAIRRS